MQDEMPHNWGPENYTPPEIGHHGQTIRSSIRQALLRASAKDCNDSRNRFIPRAALTKVINIDYVEQVLQTIPVEGREDTQHWQSVAQDVCPSPGKCLCNNTHCTGGRMIFATLLFCGREDLMLSSFSLSNLRKCDNDLPLSLNSLPLDDGDLDLTRKEKELFIHMQFQVYTPFLTEIHSRKDREIVTFPEEVSMPWIKKTRLGENSLGEVSYVEKIEIHPGNHDLVSSILFCSSRRVLS